ncbi:hypothetical protein GOP47_0013238 [Adiantum capillus-veneris]|uniref:Homoserine dehydrogenase n=1 Tax=Adiantum capillus-veneris TaxID=13818 RepID=A0A9D4ZEC7_ADICA|nr:hypothetical protein GOP47_0013238 [Adiantum capillus-veneris]
MLSRIFCHYHSGTGFYRLLTAVCNTPPVRADGLFRDIDTPLVVTMGDVSLIQYKKVLPIFLLGCGGVGQQLISHILSTRSFHATQGVHISVQAICDSNSLAIREPAQHAELSDVALNQIQLTKSSNLPLSSLSPSDAYTVKALRSDSKTRDLLEHIEQLQSCKGLIVVDCTASKETSIVLTRVVELGHSIVLANKKPLTSSMETYETLCKKQRHLRYESTVGAGLPVIATLTRFLMAGDPVHRVVGALSGTLGYVMNGLQEGKPFSMVVQQAKSLGYTEPDPRDDLSGMDVARKALILARFLGWSINMEDVMVESLFPTHMDQSKMSTEEFLKEGLLLLNAGINDRINSAKTGGKVLRYVATVANGRCNVGMVEVSQDSPLGQLKGSDNLRLPHFEVSSSPAVGTSPMMTALIWAVGVWYAGLGSCAWSAVYATSNERKVSWIAFYINALIFQSRGDNVYMALQTSTKKLLSITAQDRRAQSSTNKLQDCTFCIGRR